MAFAESLADFLDTTHGFAVSATIGAATVPVIFDAAYADALSIVSGTQPVALAASADVSAVSSGTSITINAVAYTVTAIEPDGTGLTRLRLQEA